MDATIGVGQFAGDLTMTSKLSGKVALVTGGSTGIGLGIAKWVEASQFVRRP